MAERRRKSSARKRPAQTRDREATRRALLAAGEKLFAARGYEGATLDALAEEAGANKALVSYYFGGKDGLYDAVIAAIVADVIAAVSLEIDENADPARGFKQYIRALGRGFAARPSFPAILMREYMGGGMQERPGPFRDLLKFYQMTERLYNAGRKKKIFRKYDPHQLHLSIVGPLVHFVLTISFRERTFDRVAGEIENPTVDAFTDHLARLILDGVRRDA